METGKNDDYRVTKLKRRELDVIRSGEVRAREVSKLRGDRVSASVSDLGNGSGESKKEGLVSRTVDREPGELSSESGDDDVREDVKVVEVSEGLKLENGTQVYTCLKRKFSPILWDRDDKEVNKNLSNGVASVSASLPPQPPRLKILQGTPDNSSLNVVQIQHPYLEDVNPQVSGSFPVKPSEELDKENGQTVGNGQQMQWSIDREADDVVATRNISSSRWADVRDVDEFAANVGPQKRRKSITRSESHESNLNRISLAPDQKIGGSVRKPTIISDFDESERRNGSSCPDNLIGYESDKCKTIDSDGENDYRGSDPNYSDNDPEDLDDLHGIQEASAPPARSVNMLHACRNVDEFERLNKIDEGTYGVVFRARDKKSGEIVALKKVKMEREREGFPLTSLREINILLSFHHPSIVDVKEVVVGSSLDSIFMVMEYMEHDLKGLMETMKHPYSQSEVKCLMIQLLEGVKYLHDNWVLHRDLKTSNLLLNNRGELKICDFGLSRQYGSPLKPYTQLVVTLWYRAPELLLGAKQYSTAIDMWSLGCIMAELLSKKPLFDGKTEVEQLDKIFRTLGTPSESIWPGFSKLPGVKVNFMKHQYNLLRKKFPATSFTGSPVLSDAGFDLLNQLLTYDPNERVTAEAALNHSWFREVPLPKSKDFMPTFPAQHAQDRRMRRVMKSPDPLEELRRRELQQGADLGTRGLFGQHT